MDNGRRSIDPKLLENEQEWRRYVVERLDDLHSWSFKKVNDLDTKVARLAAVSGILSLALGGLITYSLRNLF
jgi:hypothetical protein